MTTNNTTPCCCEDMGGTGAVRIVKECHQISQEKGVEVDIHQTGQCWCNFGVKVPEKPDSHTTHSEGWRVRFREFWQSQIRGIPYNIREKRMSAIEDFITTERSKAFQEGADRLDTMRELLLRSGPNEKEIVLKEMYKTAQKLRSLPQSDITN